MLPAFLRTGKDRPIEGTDDEIRQRFKTARNRVLFALTLGYGCMYTCRLSINFVKKELIDAGLMTATDLGVIGTAFLWAYAIGKLVNGGLADRANVKRFIPFGLLVSAVCNALMGTTTVVWACVALWGLNGYFQGFGAPASAVGITLWAPPSRRGTFYSIWSASHGIGEGLSAVGTAAVVTYTGWRMGYFVPALFCVAVAIGMYLFLEDRPRTLGLPTSKSIESNDLREEQSEQAADAGSIDDDKVVKEAQMAVLKHPAVWVVGLASACMYISRYAVNSWGVFYLEEGFHFSKLEAGALVGGSSVVGLLGSGLYGWISDRFFDSRRPPVTLAYGLIEVVGLGMFYFAPVIVPPEHQPAVLAVGLTLYGFTLSGLVAVLGGLFAVDITPKKAAGFAMGFVGCFSYVGAGIGETLTGALIDNNTAAVVNWSHGLTSQVNFTPAVALWFGASVASVVLAASLWNVKARED